MSPRVITFMLTVFVLLIPQSGLAWGERGHDLITRVAVQQLKTLSGNDAAILRPFTSRDHMLSHLSNVPDIVWRADYMSNIERTLNGPTHYINLERVYENPGKAEDLDLAYAGYRQRAAKKGVDAVAAGTAPWRVQQLYTVMVDKFSLVKKAKSGPDKVRLINEALLYAGLMSHFVGDLANPHHTSQNHDGQLTGNTGLHAYFETDVVAELPLTLADQINSASGPVILNSVVLKGYTDAQRARVADNPMLLILALVVNSYRHLDQLTSLDDRHSIITRSPDQTG